MNLYAEILDGIAERGGFRDRAQAEEAALATLEVLGQGLLEEEARDLSRELPYRLGLALFCARRVKPFGAEELYERVSRRERVARCFGMEHAQIVCGLVGELLSPGARARLCAHLPKDLAALFEPHGAASAEPPWTPTARAPAPGEGTTLADGRPGSGHPISEATGIAHRRSIARAPDGSLSPAAANDDGPSDPDRSN